MARIACLRCGSPSLVESADMTIQFKAGATLNEEPRHYAMFVDGQWVASSGGDVMERLSPAHDVLVSVVPKGTREDADRAVAAARAAFDDGRWADMAPSQRKQVMHRWEIGRAHV